MCLLWLIMKQVQKRCKRLENHDWKASILIANLLVLV